MPKSKHRRKNKNRKRPRHVTPPERNPPPSPAWVPRTGVALLVVGVLVIIAGYVPVVQEALVGLPLFQSNWTLILGFILLIASLLVLTRWR